MDQHHYCGFLDESVALRGTDHQEYLVCAAIVASKAFDESRAVLESLRLKGQVKVHWTDESLKRRRQIVETIAELDSVSAIVTHLDTRRRKVERYRRKCLEAMYHQLLSMKVTHATLESRSTAQDRSDLAHIVSLQGQGLDSRLRITHKRGGDEPLLWIPDAILGAVNAHRDGDSSYFGVLRDMIIVDVRTPDSV